MLNIISHSRNEDQKPQGDTTSHPQRWLFKGKKKVRSLVKGLENSFQGGFLISWASVVAQMVKNLPGMQETGVQSLGGEDPLEKRKATHSSTLSW